MRSTGPLSPERWQRLNELFDELAERPETDRSAQLDGIAALDPELASALRNLLAADAAAGDLLDAPLALGFPSDETYAASEAPPERAGAYRIVEQLGRGGMADVFTAERDDGAFEQRVAIKVIRRGLDTRDLLDRFLRERRILARLEHPAIARLLDGGALADGRPYLVLERVEGEPLDRYADRTGLSIRQRLRLLRDACNAVAYAHRNLVVHRDLKPSNVLVSASGELKLLDFGIAKLLSPDADGRETVRELRLLSPAFASPEQLAGDPTTTATDVWGLGALAYQLLVGEPPLAGRAPRGYDHPDLRLEPAPKASLRARDRGARRSWSAELEGDLDVILERALALDPARRYPSVEALGDDLDRQLSNQPVRARGDSFSYRARKFVRRHRVGVAAASATAVALVGGIALASWQAHVARRERAIAERSNDRNEALIEFMLGDLLEELEPSNRLDVVGKLTAAVLNSLEEIPAAQRTDVIRAQRARVLLLSATVRRSQGDSEEAERELRESMRTFQSLPTSTRTERGLADAATHLALVLEDKGDFEAAVAAAEDSVARWTTVRATNPDDVEVRVGLADALNQLGREQLTIGKTADSLANHQSAIAEVDGLSTETKATREVAITLYDAHLYAGRALEYSGEVERAAEHFQIAVEQATAFSAAHPDDLTARHQISILTNDRARALRKLGDLDASQAAYESGLVVIQEVVEKDPGNLIHQSDLSASHAFLGRVAELRGDLERALVENRADAAVCEDLVRKEPESGLFRSYLAAATSNEGRVLMSLGRLAESLTRHDRALALRNESLLLTPEDVVAQADAGESHLERGRVLSQLGRLDAARAEWERAAELLESALRESEHPQHRVRYARALLHLGQVDRARPVVERLLQERAQEPELMKLWHPMAAATPASRTSP